LVPRCLGAARRVGPHVKHYASSRLEAAGRARLAKGAAAFWDAISAAVMFALT
jgi:hypothetical protein